MGVDLLDLGQLSIDRDILSFKTSVAIKMLRHHLALQLFIVKACRKDPEARYADACQALSALTK